MPRIPPTETYSDVGPECPYCGYRHRKIEPAAL